MARYTPKDLKQPRFDPRAQTTFLRRTTARALTPRAKRRAEALIEMERLLALRATGHALGTLGFMLSSIARAFPVSHRAIELELQGRGPQDLVHLAERIELDFWPRPDWDRKHTSSSGE